MFLRCGEKIKIQLKYLKKATFDKKGVRSSILILENNQVRPTRVRNMKCSNEMKCILLRRYNKLFPNNSKPFNVSYKYTIHLQGIIIISCFSDQS